MAQNGLEMDSATEDRLLAEDETKTEDYSKLTEYGISTKVAEELVKIYKTGKLIHADLDERALDALKELNAEDAVAVLKQFCESSLEHVTNKSAFLCGIMKTYRQNKIQGSTATTAKGPDEAKLKEILDRTGYSLDVTTGQRKYGGPPPGCDEATAPGAGHEVFVGKIPKDVFEDDIIPLFEKCGKIWDLRLMMDPLTGFNRGYCFVTYCEKEGAQEAVKQLNNYQLKQSKLKVNVSIANTRLFVGNIPKSKSKDEIFEEFSSKTDGITEVIIYRSAEKENQKNRGFAFLEYDSHKSASTAKRKLATGRVKVWGCDIIVDWADPVEEPDDETMSKVKVLYVRNLTSDVTEEQMREKFSEFGKIEKVKKIKDYGFVHFEERDDAVKAQEAMNGQQKLGKLEIEVSLAKPAIKNDKKEERKRAQERRQYYMYANRGQTFSGYDDWYPPPPVRGVPYRGMGRRGPFPSPAMGYDDFDYYPEYDDFYYDRQPPFRGRGRGPPVPPPIRGRGGVPPPPRGGRGGVAGRSRGAVRGGGGPGGARGRGAGPSARGSGQSKQNQTPRGGKRKAGNEVGQAQNKRRNTQDNWGAQPIAQQPLDESSYGGGGYNDAQWYQDSYGQNWG